MTFFIPPVFLFGNNANRFHNNEEEKSEYKTAAETGIKIENWNIKRIAELEEENRNLREKLEKMEYGNSLAFDDIERICNEKLQLKEDNKKLKEENEILKEYKLMYEGLIIN